MSQRLTPEHAPRPTPAPRKLVACLASAVLVLGACSFNSGSKGGSSGALTIAVQEDVRSPDNIAEQGTTTDKLIMGSTVYEPLFDTNKDGDIEPDLATGATSSADFKTWTIKLRHGVTFSNGDPFNAQAVKDNIEAFLDPKSASGFAGDLAGVASFDTPDQYTVVFHLKAPDARFTALMQNTMYMSDIKARKKPPLLQPGEVPIGTGPYKWSSRVPGSSLSFVPNDSFWRGKPPLSKVTFKVIPDGQTAVIALQGGEVDMIANYVPPQSLPTLEKDKNIQIVKAEGGTYYHVWTNFAKKYKNGDDVRRGLAYLMNSQSIIPKLIGAFGTLATQPIPPWQPGHDPNMKSFPYDPAKGEQLLAEGGIPKGGTIDMLSITDRPFLCQWAQAVQSNLKKLGYNPTLQCLASAVIPKTYLKYQWDLLFYRNSGRPTAAGYYAERFGSAVAKSHDDTYTLEDPKLDEIVTQMNATKDQQEYNRLGMAAAHRIINTDVASIPGYFDDAYFPVDKRVHGLVISPLEWYGLLYNAMGKVTVS